jgi:hypothetical protein
MFQRNGTQLDIAILTRAAEGSMSEKISDDRWCILRTSGLRTLALTKSLVEGDIEAWTPTRIVTDRALRCRKRVEREVAIAPTFVFAKARHLGDLACMRTLPVNPHPSYSIFTYAGRIPLVTNSEIVGLRDEEERNQVAHAAMKERQRQEDAREVRRKDRRDFPDGTPVKTSRQAFQGMTGIIEQSKGNYALVMFPGWSRSVKIDTCELLEDIIQDTPARWGLAA